MDFPAYTANEPIGRGQGAFGPVSAGLKFAALHTCNLSEGRATLLTAEVEGQYWADPRPSMLPGEGNAVTTQVMWAQLWYPWFTQGEAGYTQRIGSGITGGWFVNTSLGSAIGAAYAVQLEVEADNQSSRPVVSTRMLRPVAFRSSRYAPTALTPDFLIRSNPADTWLSAIPISQARLSNGFIR